MDTSWLRIKVHPITVGCLGWLTGIFFSSFYPSIYLFLLPAFLAFIFALFSKKQILFSIFFLTLALGMFRFAYSNEKITSDIDSLSFGKSAVFSGVVARDIEERKFGVQFVADGFINESSQKVRVLVRVDDTKVSYGDAIEISGNLEIPEPFVTSSGSLFDYPGYLKKDGISAIFEAKSIEVLKSGGGSSVMRSLYKFNNALKHAVRNFVPSTAGDLTNGVLLGDKSIMRENREAFISTGTVHIIALSGYNVSVVADFFRNLFSFLPLQFSLLAGGLSIILFVLMTGLQSSALRAGVMACIVLYARGRGREANIGRVILFAAVLMTLWNPWLLVYDVSFQLSFLATIGVIYISRKIEKYFRFVPKKVLWFDLREVVTATLGAQIFVLPFLLYVTGNLSFVGPIANIIIVPMVALLMLFGAGVALLGVTIPILAIPFALITKGIANIMLSIIFFFAQAPFAATTTHLSFSLMLILYVLIIYWLNPFGTSETVKQVN